MTRLALLVVVLAAALAAAGSAAASARYLEPSMERYGLCRAPSGTTVAGGISSAYRSAYVMDVRFSNGAQMIVRYGRTRHVAIWVTAHGATYRLFTFRRVANVPRRLREACH